MKKITEEQRSQLLDIAKKGYAVKVKELELQKDRLAIYKVLIEQYEAAIKASLNGIDSWKKFYKGLNDGDETGLDMTGFSEFM